MSSSSTRTWATVLTVARRIGIVVAFVLVLLRPGLGQADSPTELADVDVLVVVDKTRSMAALDWDGREPRIRGAQQDIAALSEALPGARFGLLTFGGSEARLSLPFTTDTAAFGAAVDTLYLEGPHDGSGSRADRPVPELTEVLERAEKQNPERRRLVVYVGDGEDTGDGRGQSDNDFSDVRDLIDGGAVLGYGTEDGAKMPAAEDLGSGAGFLTDPETGKDAVSHADLDNLRAIADEMGVNFMHRTEPGGMQDVADDFDPAYSVGSLGGSDRHPAKHDLTWLAGLLLLGLVLLELRERWRNAWTAKKVLS